VHPAILQTQFLYVLYNYNHCQFLGHTSPAGSA